MSRRRPASPGSRPATSPRRPAPPRTGTTELGEGTRYALIAGVAILGLAVLGIIGYLVVSALIPSNPTVARVEDEEIKLDYYTARLKGFIDLQGGAVPQQNLLALGDVLLDELINEEILLQSLPEAGITISEEELQGQVEQDLGASREEDFAAYRRFLIQKLDTTGLSEEQYRKSVRADLALTKLQESLAAEVQETAPQARFHRLNLNTEEDAEEARQRLLDGEEFADIALDLAPTDLEPETGPDFQLVETLPLELQEAIEELEPDEVSEPIAVGSQFVVIQLVEEAVRPLDDSEKDILANAKAENFIQSRRDELEVEDDLDDDELIDAFEEAL